MMHDDPSAGAVVTRSGERLLIRRLRDGDTEALQRFDQELSEATSDVFYPHGYDSATVARYIERNQEGLDRAFVALAGARIMAYFFLWELNEKTPRLGIGIADAYQGQGLGRRLMAVLIAEAKAAGADGIELTTAPENERAFRFYLKAGFRHVGDVLNVAGGGESEVEREMFLPLKPDAKPSGRPFRPPA